MSQVTFVDSREFYNLIVPGEYLLLDLRNDKDYEENQIETSKNVLENFDEIENDSDRLNKVLIYKDEKTSEKFYKKVLNYFKNKKIKFLSGKINVQNKINFFKDSFNDFYKKYPFICTKDEISDRFTLYPPHIIDNIYLSSYFIAQNKPVLKSLNIKYILNVSNNFKNDFEKDLNLNIKYHQILISDSIDVNPRDYFNESHEFFESSTNGNILVHCYQGISRSSTMIISVRNLLF